MNTTYLLEEQAQKYDLEVALEYLNQDIVTRNSGTELNEIIQSRDNDIKGNLLSLPRAL